MDGTLIDSLGVWDSVDTALIEQLGGGAAETAEVGPQRERLLRELREEKIPTSPTAEPWENSAAPPWLPKTSSPSATSSPKKSSRKKCATKRRGGDREIPDRQRIHRGHRHNDAPENMEIYRERTKIFSPKRPSTAGPPSSIREKTCRPSSPILKFIRKSWPGSAPRRKTASSWKIPSPAS